MKLIRLNSIVVPALLALLLTAGCATVEQKAELQNGAPSTASAIPAAIPAARGDQKVELRYVPIAPIAGGSGEIYLTKAEEAAPAPGEPAGQWTLGGITSKEGEKLGRVVSDTSPADMVMQAFATELKNSGYAVTTAAKMPADAAKAITLGLVNISLNEVSGPTKADARGSVSFSVDLRRNGKVLATLNYATLYANAATGDSDQLLSGTLNKALNILMDQSVRETIGLLENK